jgi:hypothetical protein
LGLESHGDLLRKHSRGYEQPGSVDPEEGGLEASKCVIDVKPSKFMFCAMMLDAT